jgi:hypothetical protein
MENDEGYFTALILSLGYDERIAKILMNCIGFMDIEEAKLYLAHTESLRTKLQLLVDGNSHQHNLLIEGLEVVEKILLNISNFPDNEKFRSLNYDSVTLQKVLKLTSGLEFMNECGFEKIESKLILNVDKLNNNNRSLLKWLNFIVEILKAKFFHKNQSKDEKLKEEDNNKREEGDSGDSHEDNEDYNVNKVAEYERNQNWKEVWNNREDDRNVICDCCWNEVVQYKSRNLNNAGWYSSSLNDRSGYSYRYECEICKDNKKKFNLCMLCFEKWEEECNRENFDLRNSKKNTNHKVLKKNSIHDSTHEFISHQPETKIKINRGPAPDPSKHRRWGT